MLGAVVGDVLGDGVGEELGDGVGDAALGEVEAEGEGAGVLPPRSNHFFTNFSASPLSLSFCRALLKASTRGDPLGNAIAEPEGPSEGITLNSRSGFELIKP